jgi:hypothetical protein
MILREKPSLIDPVKLLKREEWFESSGGRPKMTEEQKNKSNHHIS